MVPSYFKITHYCEFLPILTDGTQKYIQIASKFNLKMLVRGVDYVLKRARSRAGREGSCCCEGVERCVTSDMLQRFSPV